MSIDKIGNFLTIIRNGLMRSKYKVDIPFSDLSFKIVSLLKEEGFVNDLEILSIDEIKKNIRIYLKYVDGQSVIHEIVRVSKPSRRVYKKVSQVKPIIGKLGVSVLTTSKGIITDKQAKSLGIGGEIICTVW